MINEAGGTVERVNAQLDKADVVTTSAVDAADSVDTAVRALTIALVRPVQKISALSEGVTHGMPSLRARRGPRASYETGRAAATGASRRSPPSSRPGGPDEP